MLVALDCESEGLLWQHKAFCATTHDNENGSLFWDLLDYKQRYGLINHIAKATKIICHNLKFDAQKMLLAGVLTEDDIQYPGRYEDTLIMGHLLDEHRSNRLKDLARTVLEEETDEAKVLAKVRRELGLTKDDGYDKIPLEVLKPYALKDAEFTYRLFKIFDTALRQPSNKPLYDLYRREIRFVFTLMKVEEKGLGVDLDTTRRLYKEYGTKVYRSKKDIAEIAGCKVFEDSDLEPLLLETPILNKAGKVSRTRETKTQAKQRARDTTFNPNSPDQVLEKFAELGLNLKSTGIEQLGNLNHPLASAILALRSNMKMKQTYLSAILNESHGNVLHPNYRMLTRTGRLSSATGE